MIKGWIAPGEESWVRAKDTFVTALQWEMAARLLFESNQALAQDWRGSTPRPGGPLVTPAHVAAALSLELYLKCMLVLDTRVLPAKTHKLLDLFDALPPSRVKELHEAHEWIIAAKPFLAQPWRTLRRQMTAANDVFVRWRYEHEGVETGSGFSTHLVRIARGVILRANPSWGYFAGPYGLHPHAHFVKGEDRAMKAYFPIEVVDYQAATFDPGTWDRPERDDSAAD